MYDSISLKQIKKEKKKKKGENYDSMVGQLSWLFLM